MLKIALSHDIDRTKKTFQFISKPLTAAKNLDWKQFVRTIGSTFKKDNYWNFDKIIGIEEKYGVKSTFFFLNESIKVNFSKPDTLYLALGRYSIDEPRIVEMIKWLDQNGWEIGVHGSFNSFHDQSLLESEKLALEQILGHRVRGIRQHHLNLDDSTWEIQNKLGFVYDSSFGSNEANGWYNDQFEPFFPLKDKSFVVFPLVLMDFCLLNGSDYEFEIERLMDLAIKKESILVVNFHNDKFNRHDFPGYEEAYVTIIEKGIEKGATFKTLGEFYDDYIQNTDI